MSTASAAALVIAAAGVVALAVALVRSRSRELALRSAVAEHVEAFGGTRESGAGSSGPQLGLATTDQAVTMLGRLGSAIDARHAADDRQRRLMVGAVERIRPQMFLADAVGAELFRNAPGATVGTGEGDAILEGAVRELLKKAATGLLVEQELNLAGPPRKDFILRAFPVEHSGERFGSVAIADDVTELRRIERVRRDFVSNISHELRTPLGALAVLAEAASMETDADTLQRLTGRMEYEAHRLTAMVDDVLALSRVEGESLQEPEVIEIDRVVSEAIGRAASSAAQRQLTVETAPIDPTLRVRGDRLQLVSAVHNLIENALKYSDKGEPVRVSARRTDDPAHVRELVEILVVDRGIGIPARDRERIFERFYRVDRARARDTGGTGLGLAIVRHVAVNHNGEVLVDSIEGEGSTFVLRLPSVRLDGGGDQSTETSTRQQLRPKARDEMNEEAR